MEIDLSDNAKVIFCDGKVLKTTEKTIIDGTADEKFITSFVQDSHRVIYAVDALKHSVYKFSRDNNGNLDSEIGTGEMGNEVGTYFQTRFTYPNSIVKMNTESKLFLFVADQNGIKGIDISNPESFNVHVYSSEETRPHIFRVQPDENLLITAGNYTMTKHYGKVDVESLNFQHKTIKTKMNPNAVTEVPSTSLHIFTDNQTKRLWIYDVRLEKNYGILCLGDGSKDEDSCTNVVSSLAMSRSALFLAKENKIIKYTCE